QYENGSKGIYNQYYYFNSGYITKWLYIMPSYNKTFFNNKINLDFRANYRYDIALDDKYLAFNTIMNFYLPYEWTLWLLNSVNTNTKRDQVNNSTLRYTTVFFEAGIRKEFNCKQPRFQYYDLNIVFFKIPYLENNRIIGKVILNRDPLSSLGPIDISNIRVIAEDTQGHSYSALTDKQGNFVLYTPVTDHYILKINNIFYESFDIQQPEYIVKFNGYKQFEVTFVFDEKKKTISYNDPVAEDIKVEDIKVIRKTTLTGKIRDAISLDPIEAEIKIIDNKSNKVISRTISNRFNGNYNISYAADAHYRIEILSKDYWEYVENLYIEQVISIQNINKDIMLNKISGNRGKEK
ncbi:MAG: hypothetical protein B6I20_04430, partial [Bacteroidetes bacterium 4572_117]